VFCLKGYSSDFRKTVYIVFFIFFLAYSYGLQSTRNPKYSDVLIALGKETQGTDSLNYFKKAIFHDPSKAEAYRQLGKRYGEMGDRANEIQYYKKAVSHDLMLFNTLSELGLYYFHKGIYQEAFRYFNQARASAGLFSQAFAGTYFYLGALFDIRGEYISSFLSYLTAIDLDQSYSKAYPKLEDVYRKMADKDYVYRYFRYLRSSGKHELAGILDKIIQENKRKD